MRIGGLLTLGPPALTGAGERPLVARLGTAAPFLLGALLTGLVSADHGGYWPTAWGWATLALVWAAGIALVFGGEAVSRLELAWIGGLPRVERRGDGDDPGYSRGFLKGHPKRRMASHRSSDQDGPLDPEPVHDRDQVPREVLVPVRGRIWRRGRAPVAAGIECDDVKAGVRERRRAHQDVVPGHGQPVQQHHRSAVERAGSTQGESNAVGIRDLYL